MSTTRLTTTILMAVMLMSGCVANEGTGPRTPSVTPVAASAPAPIEMLKYEFAGAADPRTRLWDVLRPYGFAYFQCGLAQILGQEQAGAGFQAKLAANLEELCGPILSEAARLAGEWNKTVPRQGFDLASFPEWKRTQHQLAMEMLTEKVATGETAKSLGLYPTAYWVGVPSARKEAADLIADLPDASRERQALPEKVAGAPPKPITVTSANFEKYLAFNTAHYRFSGLAGIYYIGCVEETALGLRKGAGDVKVVAEVALRECKPQRQKVLAAFDSWARSEAPFRPGADIRRSLTEVLDDKAREAALTALVKANAGQDIKKPEWRKWEGGWEKMAEMFGRY